MIELGDVEQLLVRARDEVIERALDGALALREVTGRARLALGCELLVVLVIVVGIARHPPLS